LTLGASRHEFEIVVIRDRSLDEQVSKGFRFGDHDSSAKLLGILVVRIAYGVMNRFYFRRFTVEAHSIFRANLFPGLV